jgi:hypothetical protein
MWRDLAWSKGPRGQRWGEVFWRIFWKIFGGDVLEIFRKYFLCLHVGERGGIAKAYMPYTR